MIEPKVITEARLDPYHGFTIMKTKYYNEEQVRELLRCQREAIANECDERWASSGDQIATYIRSLPDEI